jgi:hypothetical protein
MSSRPLFRLAGFAVAAALLGAACGDSSDTSSQSAPVTASSGTTETPTAGVPDILAFSSPLVGGGQFDGAELSDKPTAFWFWSPT